MKNLLVLILCLGAAACGGGSSSSPTSPSSGTSSGGTTSGGTTGGGTSTGGTSAAASWSFNGTSWQATGTPPSCPAPLLGAPADLSRATAVLYPGQVRGGDYKAHGGLRFDGSPNTVTVVAPMDATVYRGVRYVEAGETQYMFDFINNCGVMFRLDHLLELSSRFAAIAATLPAAGASTVTTTISGQTVSAGETIATAIGFRTTSNVGFDFGVYDLRQRNPATTSRTGELIPYGVCWLDRMSAANNAIVGALPPGDQAQGRTSD
jgi:hypothetical protein